MQRNNDRFRDFFLDIVIHPSFDIFIMACIILNTVALAIKWYNTPENVIEILEIVGRAGVEPRLRPTRLR